MDQPLVLLVTEKRERDVLGQIVVPLSNVDDDDSRSSEPLRVPLQPGLRCPDLMTSPGELVYNVWITTRDLDTTPENRSLTSRTTASLNRLRRKLNSSPTMSSSTRWNDFKTNRRHSIDTFLDLHSDSSPDYCHMSFDEDSSPTTNEEGFMPISSSDGYIKRSSLPTVFEYYFPRPQILEVCPSEGPTTGGTVVTVRGRGLGLNRDDVVGLFICGSDVLDSVQYISSERLVCTTVAWRPCVGCVTVETGSGGRACSTAQFTFTARSEPPMSRLYPSPVQPTSELPMTKKGRRRFSLDALENVTSSNLFDDKPQRSLDRNVHRRQNSHEVATSSSELCPPVVAIHPVRTSDVDDTRTAKILPQTEDHSHRKLYSEKVAQI